MAFTYRRTIHFSDTDAAGVAFFANFLVICHEAYEESLAAAGVGLAAFFAAQAVVIPIAKSEAEFLRPLGCGDQISVTVKPAVLSASAYEVRYEITRPGLPAKCAARVRTEHVCIDAATRARRPVPAEIAAWISANA